MVLHTVLHVRIGSAINHFVYKTCWQCIFPYPQKKKSILGGTKKIKTLPPGAGHATTAVAVNTNGSRFGRLDPGGEGLIKCIHFYFTRYGKRRRRARRSARKCRRHNGNENNINTSVGTCTRRTLWNTDEIIANFYSDGFDFAAKNCSFSLLLLLILPAVRART